MSFVRVGSGLSFKSKDEQSFAALAKRLEPHWKDYDPQHPPALLQLRGGSKERPDKWIDPRDSVVLEVAVARCALDAFTPLHAIQIRADYRFIDTQVYALPFSLRFPRIKRVRYDKSFAECMSDAELIDLFESAKIDPLVHVEFTTANMLRCADKKTNRKRPSATHQVVTLAAHAMFSRA
jgi:DNA ligase-4